MGIGQASGENRATTAARAAISSPLLEVSIEGAKGILYIITGGPDMTLPEISDASQIITQAADPDANIIFGATIDGKMGSNLKIAVIATGFDENRLKYQGGFARRSFGAYGQASEQRAPVQQQPSYQPPVQQQPLYQPQQATPVYRSQAPAAQQPQQSYAQQPQMTPVMSTPQTASPAADDLDDEFDIPAFLRQGK